MPPASHVMFPLINIQLASQTSAVHLELAGVRGVLDWEGDEIMGITFLTSCYVPGIAKRCQQCPESTAARNECTPICNDWVITLFAVSTLFWRSGRPHLCSVSNCQAGAASASSICILHWGVALQMIMLNCFCNRNVQSNKVNDLERHGERRGGGRKLNRLKCRCSPSDGGHDGGVVSM